MFAEASVTAPAARPSTIIIFMVGFPFMALAGRIDPSRCVTKN